MPVHQFRHHYHSLPPLLLYRYAWRIPLFPTVTARKMSHSHHPPFKQVEATRPDWDTTRHSTYSKTLDPNWRPGQGIVSGDSSKEERYYPSAAVHLLNPAELGLGQAYKLLINGVVPRPIAFLSSQDEQGQRNLAPFSFFNVVSVDPPVVAISIIGSKDSWKNIEQTKRYVLLPFQLPIIPPLLPTSWRGR